MSQPTRIEKDSMGEMAVPADAYYGASTARAVENFPISSLRPQRRFIAALGLIKSCAACVSESLGLLDAEGSSLVRRAADDVIAGTLDDQFVVDVFQTGSGTSTNMNANEVIASRANELATGQRGGKSPVHPNDHVNLQQSSNDVIPTAMQVSAALATRDELLPALLHLQESLDKQAAATDGVIKIGRTHLQDATPIRLGQEFSGYARQVARAGKLCGAAAELLAELPIGGTAVGTGINSHPAFAGKIVAELTTRTGFAFREAANHFEAQAARDVVVAAHGNLRTVALALAKIANDLRWLGSGPRCGLGEISLPATQPGSSIMPGKVNPVMCEMVLQVVAKVIGNDATIAFAGSPLGSTFELNTMMPVMAFALLESIELLSRAARVFADRCVDGITVNEERCAALVEQSLAMCTSLAPIVGYDVAADVAKESFGTGRTVRQVAAERKLMPAAELDKVLDARRMTEPQADMVGTGGG